MMRIKGLCSEIIQQSRFFLLLISEMVIQSLENRECWTVPDKSLFFSNTILYMFPCQQNTLQPVGYAV